MHLKARYIFILPEKTFKICVSYEHTEIQNYISFIWNSVSKFISHQQISSQKNSLCQIFKKFRPYGHLETQVFNLIPVTGFHNVCVIKPYWISKLFVIHLKLGLKNSYHTSMQIHKNVSIPIFKMLILQEHRELKIYQEFV